MKFLPLIFAIGLSLQGCSSFGPKTDDYGKRTFGTRLDDSRKESLAKRNIKAADPKLDEAHLDVTSFNGTILITGQVATETLVGIASKAIEGMRNIKKVHNELEVAGPTSLIARANDNWLTTKIKSSMAVSSATDANRIKVVTENGIVYLLGLLTREEAEAAVQLTRKTYGVQKIVKVFEYIN
ncbi:MAG: phospholipid-binding protein [Gammaproteobacteria bacterium]|jgi:osmotically-inducible protein OsmY|nr:phospholipid-binding protein [Gammaproteobacteria bacterium]|tara:strand:- start:263 stop:811 length:549 start_codon:yes stop_codon:yes gene_type:complete